MFLIMANQLGVQFPPEVLQSTPPDPSAMAAAASQQANMDTAAPAASPAPPPAEAATDPNAPVTPLGIPPLPPMGKAASEPIAEIIGMPYAGPQESLETHLTGDHPDFPDVPSLSDTIEAVAYRAANVSELFKRARHAR